MVEYSALGLSAWQPMQAIQLSLFINLCTAYSTSRRSRLTTRNWEAQASAANSEIDA